MQLSQKTPITTLTNVSGEILAQICSYLDDWTCQGKNESVHGRPSHYALALTCRALSTLIRPLMYSKMSFDCSHKSGLDSLKLLSQELSDSPNMINLINSVRLWCILPGSQANARLSRFLDVLAGSESLNRFELTGWPQDLVHCSVIPLVCSGGFRRLRNLSILADRHSGSTSVGAAAPLFTMPMLKRLELSHNLLGHGTGAGYDGNGYIGPGRPRCNLRQTVKSYEKTQPQGFQGPLEEFWMPIDTRLILKGLESLLVRAPRLKSLRTTLDPDYVCLDPANIGLCLQRYVPNLIHLELNLMWSSSYSHSGTSINLAGFKDLWEVHLNMRILYGGEPHDMAGCRSFRGISKLLPGSIRRLSITFEGATCMSYSDEDDVAANSQQNSMELLWGPLVGSEDRLRMNLPWLIEIADEKATHFPNLAHLRITEVEERDDVSRVFRDLASAYPASFHCFDMKVEMMVFSCIGEVDEDGE